jgi:hypothetical protein
MFYIHPWEMDDWVPEVAAPRIQMVRTFAGRRRIWRRLERMFAEFRFTSIRRTLEQMGARSSP